MVLCSRVADMYEMVDNWLVFGYNFVVASCTFFD